MKLTCETVTTLYLDYLKGLRRVKYQSKKRPIRMLFESLKKNGKDDLRDAGRQDILNFALYLDRYRRKDKKGIVHLSRRTKAGLMRDVKLVFEYLYISGLLLTNVFEKLDDIKFRGVETIRKVFTHDDMRRFLECIDMASFYGLRSRVIFELMYSSGLRLMEAVNLNVGDIDLEAREAVIRCSKFKKDRVVPLSEVAQKFIKKYLDKTKKLRAFIKDRTKEPLFLRSEGLRMGQKGITHYFDRYIRKCGLKGKGYTVHSIRHATATHLLESGADIRYVQELLGHENPDTTAKYTHLMIDSLKKVYRKFHPRENEHYKEIDAEYLSKVKFLKERILVDRAKRARWKKSK